MNRKKNYKKQYIVYLYIYIYFFNLLGIADKIEIQKIK